MRALSEEMFLGDEAREGMAAFLKSGRRLGTLAPVGELAFVRISHCDRNASFARTD
jgi:hypothetical protein